MNTVQPIRNKKDIEKMKKALEGNPRDLLLFTLGINFGLRISDLLNLKVGDVRNQSELHVKEGKTEKLKTITINQSSQDVISKLIPETAEDSDFLFPSREGSNKPITRQTAYNILNNAAKRAGIDKKIGKIGTHTLRKTFGYQAYSLGIDISLLQSILNHASQKDTLRYIGIEKDDIQNVYESIDL